MLKDIPKIPEISSERLVPIFLLLYFVLYFLVPYKPWDLPVSFHTLALGAGFVLLLPNLRKAVATTGGWFAPDLVVFYGLVALFLFSSVVVHYADFSRPGVQAYMVSFISFLFVRLVAPVLPQRRFYFGLGLLLAASGLLMLLQVNFAGGFYVAGFLGETNFGKSCQAWGFANTHILAGGMLAWMITVLLGRYSVPNGVPEAGWKDSLVLCSLGLGAGGVFYTLSRGAWLGLAAGISVVAIRAFMSGSAAGKRVLKGVFAIFCFVVLFRLLPHPGVANIDQKLAFIGNFASKPAEAVVTDASVNTRAKAWGVAVGGIQGSPLWGIGVSKFPDLYEKYFPTFYSGDNSRFDPNPRQIPHNSYLYFAVEAGIIPALFLLALVAVVVFRGIIRGDTRVFPFAAGLISVCAWILTCDYINERVFWIALGLVAGLGSAARAAGPAPAAVENHE